MHTSITILVLELEYTHICASEQQLDHYKRFTFLINFFGANVQQYLLPQD